MSLEMYFNKQEIRPEENTGTCRFKETAMPDGEEKVREIVKSAGYCQMATCVNGQPF